MGLIKGKAFRFIAVPVVALGILVGGAGLAQASTGVVGGHGTRYVQCQSPDSTSFTTLAPTIKAVNSTTSVDRQHVAYQPVVYKWDGSSWVQFQTGMRFYGTATDSASPSAWYDWATGANEGNGAQSASMTSRGYYRVAIKFQWFNANWQLTGSDYVWSVGYQTPIGSVTSECSR